MPHRSLHRLAALAALLLTGAALFAPAAARAELPEWGIGPFIKADAVNPIVEWFLYYGPADSKVAVASAPGGHPISSTQ